MYTKVELNKCVIKYSQFNGSISVTEAFIYA